MTVLTTRPQTDIPFDGAADGPDLVGTVLISRGGTICRHGRFSRKGSGSGVFSKWEGGVHECRPTQGDAEGFDRNACPQRRAVYRRGDRFDTGADLFRLRVDHPGQCVRRSEEHTSELQSLMRTSYAVFCLKKKTHTDKSSPHQARTNTHLTSTQQCTSLTPPSTSTPTSYET